MEYFFLFTLAISLWPTWRNLNYKKNCRAFDACLKPNWGSGNGDPELRILYKAEFIVDGRPVLCKVENYQVTLGNICFRAVVFYKTDAKYCLKAGLVFYYPVIVAAISLFGSLVSLILGL